MFDIKNIKDPSFLQDLSKSELTELAKEIRSFIIEKVSVHGGHLGGNLGIVELTIAMEKHYSHGEKFIFDVGHQMYTHKILTGRASQFDTLREINGLSGLSSRDEIPYGDTWEVGHASTSIAALSGFVLSNVKAVAIIGDGALSGGEALEGLEFLASLHKHAIVILNENHYSISPTVGIMSDVKDINRKVFFESMGYTYLGPVDGHNFEELENAFNKADSIQGPIILHVLTTKGRGYSFAENDKIGAWHCVGPFDQKTGMPLNIKKNMVPYVSAVNDYLSQFYRLNNHQLKVINPAMTTSSKMNNLMELMQNDYIDTGITEELAITLSSALSMNNPYVFLSIYSSFLQRGYDQLHQDISLQNLHVVIGIEKIGIIGETGKTHQGLYAVSYLRTIPNFTIIAPRNYQEVFECLDYAFLKAKGPVAVIYPSNLIPKVNGLVPMKSEINESWVNLTKHDNPDLYLISYSNPIEYTFDTIKDLNIDIINARFIRPLDNEMLIKIAKTNKPIVVFEEAPTNDSLGSMILSFYNEEGIKPDIHIIGYPLEYIGVGSIDDLRHLYHMDAESLKEKLLKILCA